MRTKQFLILSLCVLALAACSSKKNTQSSESSSTKASVTQKSTVSSSSEVVTSETQEEVVENSTEEAAVEATTPATATQATYNGYYYSLQGKYGEVIIANKKHPVSASYAPGENPTALSAFRQLQADMQALGYNVSNQYSGFRSYETQAGLYNNYVAADGQANADRYSARPGYSEHQTGLAFDLMDTSGSLLTEYGAVTWLANNAHRYGFVVRYVEGKEGVTGYMTETWHIRYIGQEATDIYQSGLTLEEYYGVPGGGYE